MPIAEIADFFSDQAEDLLPMDFAWQDNPFDFDQEFHFGNHLNDELLLQEALPARISDLDIGDKANIPNPVPASRSTGSSATPKPRPRAKVIPEHIWDKHKSTIEYLYLEKDLTLAKVRAHMIANHNFDAS